jgi:hypothetical protein
MSDPCKGEGATHYACPCFLDRISTLEARLKEALEDFKMVCGAIDIYLIIVGLIWLLRVIAILV